MTLAKPIAQAIFCPLSSRGVRLFVAFVASIVAVLCLTQPVAAHTRSQSQSSWSIEGDAITARVEAEAVDVTRLYALGGDAPLAETFANEVQQAFTVKIGTAACTQTAEPVIATPSGAGRFGALLRFTCPEGALARGPIEIESQLFLAVAPSHLHFAAVRDAQNRTAEAVLTESNPRATLSLEAAPEAETFWGAVVRFIPVGAAHVWSGLDHIAFMLALVLFVGGRLRAAIFAATGFTLGHTATLGLAATGVLAPDISAIEALIGFTIAFVALEIGADGAARMRNWSLPIAGALALTGVASMLQLAPLSPLIWYGLAAFVLAYPRGFPRDAGWLAAIFGLIHGCGFAGALSELDLPPQRLLASLFGFNLGVELGQIVVIGSALLVGLVVRRLPNTLRASAAAVAGAALFALGVFWFVGRLAA
jgi:hypothetical protein